MKIINFNRDLLYWYIWNETCDNGLTWQQKTATVFFGVLLARDNPVLPQWSFAKTTCSWKLHNILLTITHIQWSIAQPTGCLYHISRCKAAEFFPPIAVDQTHGQFDNYFGMMYMYTWYGHFLEIYPLKMYKLIKLPLKIYSLDTVISDLYWFRKKSCAVYINEDNAYINV